MSNPARAPMQPTATQLKMVVAPDAYFGEGYEKMARGFKKVENAQKALQGLDMEVSSTFQVPKDLTVDSRVLSSKGPVMGLAKTGIPSLRIRSSMAKTIANRVFEALPSSGFGSRELVGKAMVAKVYVDAGTEGAVGRLQLAYPRLGSRPARPVTRAEAEMAIVQCGVGISHLPSHVIRPYPLNPLDGEDTVKVNPVSDNGFPVLGKWNTDGAAIIAMGLAKTVQQEIRHRGDGEAWLREAETTRPWLVAVRGKAKADYYTEEKVRLARMRFYNAFPRQTMLVMQTVTQVLELHSRSCVNDGAVRSAIGATMVRGGAGTLVGALEEQLMARGWAYVHVGDDSWVVRRRRDGHLELFALDCSNFDLTQHSEVTREVHAALKKQLALIEPRAAELWHGYARERLVVTVGAMVRRFKHAGPSGMPLQSKVNDMLMDVLLGRIETQLGDRSVSEEEVGETVAGEATAMGFVVKLEQYWKGTAASVFEALEQRPFQFIGYYFHVRGGEVMCCADVPRMMAQLPYPATGWAATLQILEVSESLRLGSILMNLGMPTRDLEPAFEAYRKAASGLLAGSIEKYGDTDLTSFKQLVMDNVFAGGDHLVVPSMSGLLKAIQRNPRQLWMDPELELISSSRLVAVEGGSWADEVETEEREEGAARPGERPVKAVRIPQGSVPTHPPTLRNDGRPAPTVVWGPDKPRLQRLEVLKASTRARRRDGLLGRDFKAALRVEMQQQTSDDEWNSDDEHWADDY